MRFPSCAIDNGARTHMQLPLLTTYVVVTVCVPSVLLMLQHQQYQQLARACQQAMPMQLLPVGMPAAAMPPVAAAASCLAPATLQAVAMKHFAQPMAPGTLLAAAHVSSAALYLSAEHANLSSSAFRVLSSNCAHLALFFSLVTPPVGLLVHCRFDHWFGWMTDTFYIWDCGFCCCYCCSSGEVPRPAAQPAGLCSSSRLERKLQ